MSSTDETKPAVKPGRRNKKGEARRQKSSPAESPAPVEAQTAELEGAQVPQMDPQATVSEPLEAVVAEAMGAEAVTVEAVTTEAAVAEATVAETEAIAAEAPSPAGPSEPSPVSLQTIANAYRDYARKSFEEFGSFFEQLSGVRSLDKAMEVQTEFVKRACESSVAESQKIRELHRKLARQTFEPFGSFAGKTPEAHNKP